MKKYIVTCLSLMIMCLSISLNISYAAGNEVDMELSDSVYISSSYEDGANSILDFSAASKMGDGTQTLNCATIVNQSGFGDVNQTNIRRVFLTYDISAINRGVESAELTFNAKFNGQTSGNIKVYAFDKDVFEGEQSPIEMYPEQSDLLNVTHTEIGVSFKAQGSINSAQWFTVDISDYIKNLSNQDKIVLMLDFVPNTYNTAYSAVICMAGNYAPYISVELEDIYNPTKQVKFTDDVGFYAADGVVGLLTEGASYSLGSNNTNGDAQMIILAPLNEVPFERLIKAELKLTSNYQGNDGGTLRFYDGSSLSFEDSDDFLAKYPTQDLINKDSLLGSIKDSGVSGQLIERSLDITDLIYNMTSDEVLKIIIDYVPFTEHTAYICNTAGVLSNDGFPYIELTLETPPRIENITITGDYIENETLTLDYDFVSDNREGNSEIKWYAAEKSGDSYINPNLISEDSLTLILDENTVGKYIYAEIKPVNESGYYINGDAARSDVYDKPVTGLNEISTILTELYDKEIVEEYFALLSDNDHIFKVDINIDEKKESVKSLVNSIAPNNFKDYRTAYNRAIVLTDINNETNIDNITNLIQNEKLGLKLEGYSLLQDTIAVDNEYYQKSINTLVDFDDNFNKLVAYRMMKEATRETVLEYLLYNDFVLSSDIGDLESDELEDVGAKILKKPFTDFETLDDAITDVVDDVLDDNSVGSGTSPSPGKTPSRDSSTPSFSIATNTKTETETQKTNDKAPLDVVQSSDSDNKNSEEISFSDLAEVDWAEEAIKDLADWKIVSGNGDETFGPLNEVTREQFVKMIVLAFDFKTTGPISFADVEEGAWYNEYISIAYNNRIINGISSEEFGVGSNITRQDMAVIIYNAAVSCGMNFEAINTVEFTDFENVADYAKTAVTTLASAGIINGVGDDRFAPTETANRAMAAVIIHRLLDCTGNYYSGNIFNVTEKELTDVVMNGEEVDEDSETLDNINDGLEDVNGEIEQDSTESVEDEFESEFSGSEQEDE